MRLQFCYQKIEMYNGLHKYLEPVCPLFWWLNPSKQGLFQSKQGSFGFQVYIHYIHCISSVYSYSRLLYIRNVYISSYICSYCIYTHV